MTSTLGIKKIQHPNGTNIATLDSSGSIAFAGASTVAGTLGVTGETTLATHLNMGDNDKIKLGASGDLEVYHDGSNSYIDDTGTGNLRIRANDQVKIQKYTGENMFVGIADGAASMYYDNSQKIATTSTGVSVTGGATLNSGTLNMSSSLIQFSGNLSLPNVGACLFRPVADTIAFGINNGQRVSVNQHGLLFGTDTSSANALDDYEEGTWTPVPQDESGNSGSGANMFGSYVKIGRFVQLSFTMQNVNTTGLTTNQDLRISGLPFTAASLSSSQFWHGGVRLHNVTFNGHTDLSILDNTNYMRILETTSGATADFVRVSEIVSGTSDFYGSISYYTAP